MLNEATDMSHLNALKPEGSWLAYPEHTPGDADDWKWFHLHLQHGETGRTTQTIYRYNAERKEFNHELSGYYVTHFFSAPIALPAPPEE